TDTSAGTISNRFWEFGDGATTNLSATHVTHVYNAPGAYTVRLTVSGPVGTNVLALANYIVVTNAGPLLLVDPARVDFGPVIVDSVSTQTLRVVNLGDLTLTGSVSTLEPFWIDS